MRGFFKFTRGTRADTRSSSRSSSRTPKRQQLPFTLSSFPCALVATSLLPPTPAVGGFNDLTAKNRARRPRDGGSGAGGYRTPLRTRTLTPAASDGTFPSDELSGVPVHLPMHTMTLARHVRSANRASGFTPL